MKCDLCGATPATSRQERHYRSIHVRTVGYPTRLILTHWICFECFERYVKWVNDHKRKAHQ
jgi:hypothetical protein